MGSPDSAGQIIDLQILNKRTRRVMWQEEDNPAGIEYRDLSVTWSPSGEVVAIGLAHKRTAWLEIYRHEDGRFVRIDVDYPDNPAEDLGRVRFETVEAERWVDDTTLAARISGTVQLYQQPPRGLLKEEWAGYEYSAVIRLNPKTRTGVATRGPLRKPAPLP